MGNKRDRKARRMSRPASALPEPDDFPASNGEPGQSDALRVQDLDLNLLKTFHAVFIEKHVGRAALRLGVTQPSVSHALGRLRLSRDCCKRLHLLSYVSASQNFTVSSWLLVASVLPSGAKAKP